MAEIALATDEEFWGDAALAVRLRSKVVRPQHEGIQYLLQFVNGYGLSIINGAGLGVEVMILDMENGTVAGGDVPAEALFWVRNMLAEDTIIAHLEPVELRDIIFDVAYWPDLPAMLEYQKALEEITDGNTDD